MNMEAFAPVTKEKKTSLDTAGFNADSLIELCSLSHETDDRLYTVRLETNTAQVSLEGMNEFRISVISQQKVSNRKETLWSSLEINLREEMNSVSIADGSPYYFIITGKSLELDNDAIDSSIHEAVDLGLLDHRILTGLNPLKESKEDKERQNASIFFDAFSCNLIKASISTLLSYSTFCHKQVIHNAGRLFASRQDYVRDMCNCMANNDDSLSSSITSKALNCDLLIL